jgi:hypothetical protein
MNRKLDVRHKIELGGLIIKAGLGDYPKAIILGLLLEAKAAMDTDYKIAEHYQALGDLEFSATGFSNDYLD